MAVQRIGIGLDNTQRINAKASFDNRFFVTMKEALEADGGIVDDFCLKEFSEKVFCYSNTFINPTFPSVRAALVADGGSVDNECLGQFTEKVYTEQ